MPQSPRRPSYALLILICLCFGLTGAAGLIYEVIWNRTLALYMGNTSYALSTLLAIFMAGLATGAWAGGRFAPPGRKALAAYAILEIGTGLYCALLPSLLTVVEPSFEWIYQNYYFSFVAFNLMQFAIAGALLAPPTIMMGATLPILVKALTESIEGISSRIGLIYAVNALGATAGALVTGFVLLPKLGVGSSYLIAVTINVGVGLVVATLYLAGRRRERGDPVAAAASPARPSVPSPFSRHGLLASYAVCGLAAMVLQVSWTRALTMIFGSSNYAFSMITAAFILGLSLGSWVLGWIGDRAWASVAIGGIATLIGIAGVGTVGLLAELPVEHTLDMITARAFSELEWARFRSSFVIFLVPTFGMGALFPIVSHFLATSSRDAANAVGDAYSINTLGTIVGAIVAGFVLIPWIGMRSAIVVGSALYVVTGSVWLFVGARHTRFRTAAAAGALVAGAAAIAFAPEWDRSVMTSGAFLRAPIYAEGGRVRSASEIRRRMQQRILFYKEGHSDVTTVVERASGRRDLIINGKPDAYSLAGTQDWLGQLPFLLKPDARSALLIGLGSGSTLAAIETHDTVQRIDVVELSPGVVEAARKYFSEFTGNALDDARVHLIVGDGRLHLEYATTTYDAIVSQPSNPWMAGAAAMFTEESFAAMRARLNDGGIACIWFQGFSMPAQNFRILAKTWATSWEHSSVWNSPAIGEFLFVGSDVPLSIDFRDLGQQLRQPAIRNMLTRIGMPSSSHVLSELVTTGEGLGALSRGAATNSDDNGRIEFDTPKLLGRNRLGRILGLLEPHRVDPWDFVEGNPTQPDFVAAQQLGEQLLEDNGLFASTFDAEPDERIETLRRIVERNPTHLPALAELRRRTDLAERSETPRSTTGSR